MADALNPLPGTEAAAQAAAVEGHAMGALGHLRAWGRNKLGLVEPPKESDEWLSMLSRLESTRDELTTWGGAQKALSDSFQAMLHAQNALSTAVARTGSHMKTNVEGRAAVQGYVTAHNKLAELEKKRDRAYAECVGTPLATLLTEDVARCWAKKREYDGVAVDHNDRAKTLEALTRKKAQFDAEGRDAQAVQQKIDQARVDLKTTHADYELRKTELAALCEEVEDKRAEIIEHGLQGYMSACKEHFALCIRAIEEASMLSATEQQIAQETEMFPDTSRRIEVTRRNLPTHKVEVFGLGADGTGRADINVHGETVVLGGLHPDSESEAVAALRSKGVVAEKRAKDGTSIFGLLDPEANSRMRQTSKPVQDAGEAGLADVDAPGPPSEHGGHIAELSFKAKAMQKVHDIKVAAEAKKKEFLEAREAKKKEKEQQAAQAAIEAGQRNVDDVGSFVAASDSVQAESLSAFVEGAKKEKEAPRESVGPIDE